MNSSTWHEQRYYSADSERRGGGIHHHNQETRNRTLYGRRDTLSKYITV